MADDHEIFRIGFRLLVKNQPELELVGEAENGKELLQVVEQQSPDVVITDIQMPVMDGVEASKIIKSKSPYVKVIALSMFNDDNLIVDMLEAGATGYLLKNTNKHELLEAVKAVHNGESYYSPATSTKLARMIAESKFNFKKHDNAPKLTDREIEIVKLICQQCTNKEIADKLNLSARTVESHREKIQEKISARNSIGVVIYAIRHKLFKV